MLVPVVLAERTSPSPAKLPPVMDTVALARFRLSGSATVTLGESTTDAPFSVNDTEAAVPASVGGSLSAPMLPVGVATELRLLEPLPSLSSHVTVRVGFEP